MIQSNTVNTGFVITGLGVVSAAGNNLSESVETLSLGRRNAGKVTLFETSLNYPVFEVRGLREEYDFTGMRTLGLALCATDEAVGNAGLGSDLSGLRVGVSMGTTVASQLNDIGFYRAYRNEHSAPMQPVDRYLKGNLAEFISDHLKARGPALTIVNACSSGTDAIGVALSWLRSGLCDITVTGGADEMNLVPYCGFGSLGVASPELCKPFDRDRQGLNLGEGAGVLVIETAASARSRKVRSRLRVLGYGSASDSYHLTAPRPDGAGLERAVMKALSDGGIEPGDLSFINAHGTATRDNDLVEGNTLGRIFGNELKLLSTKGYTGHTLGAAGGIEAVFTAAALINGWIPACAGFDNKDENISVVPVRENSLIDSHYALSTSLAFGGNNAAVLIGMENEI